MQSQNRMSAFLPLEEYVPLTYKLDDRIDKETFFETAKGGYFFQIDAHN
jgi:hypothetical protein